MVASDPGVSGLGHLKIYNSTHLHYSHISTKTEKERDFLWIVKNYEAKEDNDGLSNESIIIISVVGALAFIFILLISYMLIV